MFIKVRLKGTAAHTPRRHPTPRGDSLHPLHPPHHKRGGGEGNLGGGVPVVLGLLLVGVGRAHHALVHLGGERGG